MSEQQAQETGGVLGTTPSTPLAIIGTIVFSVVSLYHIFLFVRHKTWCFYVMIIVSIMLAGAFGARAYSSLHPDNTRSLLWQAELLMLGPSALAITLFKLFVRMSLNITPTTQRRFSKTWVPSSIFIIVFKFTYKVAMFCQFASGAGIIGAFATPTSTTPINPHQLDIGVKMAKFGLLVQAICIGLFLIVSLHWTFIARRWPATGITDEPTKLGWQKLAFAINVSAALVIFRTIYRIFQFSPTSSPTISKFLNTHEFTFWVFEALPVLAVFILLAINHPAYCLPRTFTVFWLRERKIKKLEKKILESQTLPQHSQPHVQSSGMFTGAGAGAGSNLPSIPVYAYIPKQQ